MAVMRAIVFLNPEMPLHLGHVGWGYEYKPGIFRYGAIEIVNSVLSKPGSDNAYFSETAPLHTALKNMGTGNHGGSGFQYMSYKIFNVPHSDFMVADKASTARKPRGYLITANNCMDATYDVIVAFAKGDKNILPWPSTHWAPNWWFGDIKAAEHTLPKR